MSITIFYSYLTSDCMPQFRTFEGVRDIRFIKNHLSFWYFDKHISDFRLFKVSDKDILYFTVDS